VCKIAERTEVINTLRSTSGANKSATTTGTENPKILRNTKDDETTTMNGEEINEQCESFRRMLKRYEPLGDLETCRFNKFVSHYHPQVFGWKDEVEKTLLMALYQYSSHALEEEWLLATFQDLVMQNPQVLAVQDEDGWTLLHWACTYMYNPTALDIISFLLQQYPDAAKTIDSWKTTPLQVACCYEPSLPVIQMVVEVYPEAVQTCDDFRQTPLHKACCYTMLHSISFVFWQWRNHGFV
jgi:hypothetical protein